MLADETAQAQQEDRPEHPPDEVERDAGRTLGQGSRTVDPAGPSGVASVAGPLPGAFDGRAARRVDGSAHRLALFSRRATHDRAR